MAEAVAAIGLAASIASLVEIGGKIVRRVHDYKTLEDRGSAVFQDITDQIPLLVEVVQQLQQRCSDASFTQDAELALSRTVTGCARQAKEINGLIEKWLPSPDDSKLKRARKVLGSLQSEKKIVEALRIMETYKSNITLHLALSSTDDGLSRAKPRDSFYEVPSRQTSHFVDRVLLLEEIAHQLESNGLPNGNRKIVVLQGMGGQGKTQLALEYCRRSQETRVFQFILWVDASSEQTLVRSYGNIVDKLTDSRLAFPSEESRVTYLKDFLECRKDSWLLVLDNYDSPDAFQSIKDYLPNRNKGCLIFTSRHTGSGDLGNVIPVTKMTQDEAVQLLLRGAKITANDETTAAARAIVQQLACFPLAIDQAASYISLRKLPIGDFLEHYSNRTRFILEHIPSMWQYRKKQGNAEKETSLSAFTTWELSLKLMADTEELAAITHFLTLSAFLDSSSVGENLFRTYDIELSRLPPWFNCLLTDGAGSWDEYKFQDLVVLLKSHSLIESVDLTSGATYFSLHPLIKEWLQLRLDEGQRPKFVEEASNMVVNAIKTQSLWQATFETRRMLLSNMDACIANDARFCRRGSQSSILSSEYLASPFASVYNFHGRSDDAKFIYSTLLNHQKNLSSQDTSHSGMNLANVQRNLGNYDSAEQLYEQVLQQRTSQLGANHIDTLRALEGLALMHTLQSKYDKADLEYWRLLQERENTLGPSHADTVRVFECLADMRRHQGRYKEAEALYDRVLQTRMEDVGPDNILTMQCAEGIAIVYRHQGRYEESVRLYQEVLRGLGEQLGDEHPRYLRTALNLSIAYVHLRDYIQAETWALRAQQGLNRLLGPDHVDAKRATEQLQEVRRVKDSQWKDVLFHYGRQTAARYELEERRQQRPNVSASDDPHKPDVADTSETIGFGAFTLSDSRLVSKPIRRRSLQQERVVNVKETENSISDGGTDLVDESGMKKLKCAASGNEYRERRQRVPLADLPMLSMSPVRLFKVFGANYATVVDLLRIVYGIGLDLKDKNGRTSLSRAAEDGHADTVMYLLSRYDAQKNSPSDRGWTPLMMACMHGHDQIVEILLKRPDVKSNTMDTFGRTPLLVAAWQNRLGAAKLLIESDKANVNAKDHDGWTALVWAVDHSNVEFVRLMLEAGAEHFRTTDFYQHTPLDRACYRGSGQIAKMLLADKPPDAEVANSAFQIAVGFGGEECSRLLLATGLVDIHALGKHGRTPFFSAACRGSRAICATLLDLGADPLMPDDKGDTPLHKAASYANDQVVLLILHSGKAAVDVVDKSGHTPLRYAVKHGHTEVVKHLLDAGARSDFLDPEELEFESFVKQPERREAVKKLIKDAKSGPMQ